MLTKISGLKIFIGSSSEAAKAGTVDTVASWIEEKGHHAMPWNDPGTFLPGTYTLDVLQNIAELVDAAIFIFSEDDRVWYRGAETIRPRDNVLFECGLFLGRHGHHKSIICNTGKTSFASDLDGITYISLNHSRNAKLALGAWLQSLARESANPHTKKLIRAYSNKYSMLDADHYWPNLFNVAQEEFILVGRTNESWIGREADRSTQLGESIVRLLAANKRVGLCSHRKSQDNMVDFIRSKVISSINNLPRKKRNEVKKVFTEHFKFAIANDVNYRAVLSDNLLVMLPNIMTPHFKDESIVLELWRNRHPVEYSYYVQDIRRLVNKNFQRAVIEEMCNEIRT